MTAENIAQQQPGSAQATTLGPAQTTPVWRHVANTVFLCAAIAAAWYSLEARLNVLRPDRLMPKDEAISATQAQARIDGWKSSVVIPEPIDMTTALRLLTDMGVEKSSLLRASQLAQMNQLSFDAITLRDNGRQDGDVVRVEAGPLSAIVPLRTLPTTIAVPHGYAIRITALDEGTAEAVSVSVNNIDLPLMKVGADIVIGGK